MFFVVFFVVLHEDKVGQTYLLPLNLLDLIPEDHICFFVKDVVDCYDFSEINGRFIGNAGGKAYSRRMLSRLIIFATIEGYKSSRAIEKQARLNTPYMWICGGDTPTYRTLINFKNEHRDLIEEMLAVVLAAAKEEGLVNLGVIALDGSPIKANAANRNTITEEMLELAKKLIDESLIEDNDEDEKYGEDNVGDEVSPKLTLKKKIKDVVKASQEEAQKENKEIEDINAENLDLGFKFTKNELKQLDLAYGEIEIIKKQRERSKNTNWENKPIYVSLTDPNSRFMKNKKGKTELSYNIQNVVDCDSGIILQSRITQDPTDHYQLIPQMENLYQNPNFDLENSKFLMDCAYNTQEGIEYLYKNNIDAYIPSKKQAGENKNKKLKKYAKAQFTYDYEKNQYICPEGHILPHKNTYNKNNKIKKVYYTNQCKNCPMKKECTPQSNYRIITHYNTHYQDLMEQKMEKEENKEIYKKRANGERPFAYLKHTLNRNTLTSKNKERNQTELDLITIAHNIKLTHNHKMKQIKQKNKKNTQQTKTKNSPKNQISKNSIKNLAYA